MSTVAATTKNSKAVAARAQQTPRRRKNRAGRRVRKACKRLDASIHSVVAIALIAIAAAMTGQAMLGLITAIVASGPFVGDAGRAVGEMLFALVLLEITCTVLTSPDIDGNAVCELLAVGMVGTLREILLAGMHSPSGPMLGKPLELATDTAVVIGLAVAFALMRRVSVAK